MATFTAVKSRGKSGGAMGNVLRYIQQEKKALMGNQLLVTGNNCTARTAYTEMRMTKQRYHKTDGRQYYHFVQSFSENDDLTPREAHAIGLELARKRFPDFEVVVATHMDTDHLHNHLVVNSVSYKTGMKLHQNTADLQEHRQVNDEICQAHGLSILPPPQRRTMQKRMRSEEYRAAAKGQSWKFQLLNAIDGCMQYAWTKEEFISLMESEGYRVRWTDSRKNITYTTPDGLKCRDDRLHDERYLKEVMEREFRIRVEIIHGGVETAECEADKTTAVCGAADADTGTAAHRDPVRDTGSNGADGAAAGKFGAAFRYADRPAADDCREQKPVSDLGADAGDTGISQMDGGTSQTGWEEERTALISSAYQTAAHSTANTQPVVAAGDPGGAGSGAGIVGGLVRLGHHLEHDQSAAPVMDATTVSYHTDKKARIKEQEKRLAAGHKPDDHEDEPAWQQKM